MPDLRFVGLDDAGSRLLFTLDGENELAAVVDDRLVEATRRAHGWHGRTAADGEGQAERQVETTTDELRPREIQARVRAGESPEELAAAAGVDIERIARFARPVLQEREHVAAAAAQQVVVRTGALDGPLGEVVADRLAGVVSSADETWDAWRREDGRWTIALNFRDDVQRRTARWSFDPATNSVIVDDETARWLTEGTTPPPAAAPRVTEPRGPRARRLLSVPDLTPEPALRPVDDAAVANFDDAVESDESVAERTGAADDESDVAAEIADELAALGLQPVADPEPAQADEQTAFDIPVTTPVAEAPAEAVTPPVEEAAQEQPAAPAAEETPAKPAKKRKTAKRASVPSWDDIVFGARKPSE